MKPRSCQKVNMIFSVLDFDFDFALRKLRPSKCLQLGGRDDLAYFPSSSARWLLQVKSKSLTTSSSTDNLHLSLTYSPERFARMRPKLHTFFKNVKYILLV